MGDIDLEQRFPDMNAAKRSPALFQWNGIGFALHGRRDPDPDTGTFVATHWLTFLWVPLLALGAYRVTPGSSGTWHVFGKVPISNPPRIWSWVVIASVAAFVLVGAWSRHTSSPDYRAEQKLERADEHVAAGELGAAAALYREVLSGNTRHVTAARTALRRLIEGPVASRPLPEAIKAFEVVVQIQRDAIGEPIAPDLAQRGLAIVRDRGEAEPQLALQLLRVLMPLGDVTGELTAARLPLLEAVVKATPGDLAHTIELADVYVGLDQPAKAVALLEPHRAALDDGEGARALGVAYLRVRRVADATTLLQAFTRARVPALLRAQKSLDALVDRLWKEEIGKLERGLAPDAFYRKYERSDQQTQTALVQEYLHGILDEDRRVKAARVKVLTVRGVISLVLEWGIARLHHAQDLPEASDRTAELLAAERTFLSIADAAGESDEYRLYLGQVYYWLGRAEEGWKLFEGFLERHARSGEALLEVSKTLRYVGAHPAARKLAEEAYEAPGAESAIKEAAADLRSVSSIDEEDELLWLRRCNQTDPRVASRLHRCEGRRALRAGRLADAEAHMRAAVDALAKQPEHLLNRNGLADAHLALFELNGDRAEFQNALKLIQRAAELSPRDSVLQGNAALLEWELAVLSTMGDALDLTVLPMRAEAGLLSYLYRDEASREKVTARLRAHGAFVSSRERFEQLLIIAPKDERSYGALVSMYSYAKQAPAIRALHAKLIVADLDQSDTLEVLKRMWREGGNAAERTQVEAGLTRARTTWAKLKTHEHALSRALAAGGLVETLLGAHVAGLAVPPDEVVRVAEAALRAVPCSATEAMLQGALAFRADRDLRVASTAYVHMTTPLRHALAPATCLTVALERPGPLRDAALALPDVQRILKLTRASLASFPSHLSMADWIWLRAAAPAEAAAVGKRLSARPDIAASIEFQHAFQPYDVGTVLGASWLKELQGDRAGAKALLEAAAAAGVPLPRR